MFSMMGGIFRLFGLLLFGILLASCGGGGGGDDGGFTPEKINVTIAADKTSVPVNLAGEGPNPGRPYTSTLTVEVRKSGKLLPSTITVSRSAGDAASGSLFKLDDLTQGFQRIVLEETNGIGQVYFHAGTMPGTVTITASAQDPDTKQTISANVNITVVGEERPAATITFTGPYVNAVLAGESRFGDPPLQNGAYSRAISVVVSDANGNPTNPNTRINFFLIDAPITGYPANPGAFFIAGDNGNPVEGGYQFSAAGGDFLNKSVRSFDRLVLDGQPASNRPNPDNRFLTGVRVIDSVLNATTLTINPQGRPFNPGPNNGASVPYIIGHAENAAILSPAFTNISGVADTILTYPAVRIGQTAVLVACTEDYSTCGILNTCDANGAGCKSVYLDVTSGSDRRLTVSATTLGPNRSTDVQMCLRDRNFNPLPATEIRYNIGSAGPATVTVDGVAGNEGAFFTGGDGCRTVTIASSGQVLGGQPILLNFTSDFVATPATITIRSPGAGKLDGLFSCEFDFEKATAKCTGTLRLTDDEGTPMKDVLIGVGNISAAGQFKLTFDPAQGTCPNDCFGKTDDQGQVKVTVELDGPGDYVFPFQTLPGGTAKYELNVTVPAPGTLQVTFIGSTEAQVGVPYSAVLQAEGGVPPYVWTLLSGSLPPGLGLSANGTIAGTPTTAGSFSFAVQVTDSKKRTGFGAFTITVTGEDGGEPPTPLQVSCANVPPTGTVGTAYNGLLTASGGTPPYTFNRLAGSLPPGLNLLPTGEIQGTPNTAGTFPFSVQATDSKSATGTATCTIVIGGGGGGGAVGSVVLLANPPQLETSGQIPVNLTAVVRDDRNVLLKDVTVTFNATNNGTIQVTRAVTDDTGTATAILTSPGDKSNREITVTASAGDKQGSVIVPVVGTTITSTGPNTAVIGSVVAITFTLKDSAGVGIGGQTLTVTSEPTGNTIVPPNPVTNAAGQATVNVTANVTGNIVASALGARGAHPLSVATDNFVFVVPDPNAPPVDVCLSATNCTPPRVTPPQELTVQLTSNNAGVPGNTVTFETTRGTLSTLSAVTDGNGRATTSISSNNAGPAVITAKTTDTTGSPIQAQVQINFVATTPTQMTLQATPATVSVNVPPNTDQKSTITATVRDAAFNLVKGVTVTFTLTDVTGGSISPASAVTDEFGQASTVYTAGTSPSALNGVTVNAAVTGFPVSAEVKLTVAQRALFITLGTGNTIEEPDPQTYAYPYSVLVTDTAGLPVQNAQITLNIVPVAASTGLPAYRKGFYELFEDLTPPWRLRVTASCFNEDANQNGILDPGEDFNSNGRLEPGNVVTLSATSLTTNASGFAFFNVRYAQQYANWVRVELSARASVAGSEATEIARFILPILASDLSSAAVSPPGNPSPFGVADNCANPN